MRVRVALLGVLVLALALTGCYHHVPTREPGRQLSRIRLTSGELIELRKRERAYWQDTVVVIQAHVHDDEPRIIPGSQIAETWAHDLSEQDNAPLGVLLAVVGVLVLAVTSLYG